MTKQIRYVSSFLQRSSRLKPSRSFATALSTIPSSSSNPHIHSKSTTVTTTDGPSPIGSSSKFTLDHPFWYPRTISSRKSSPLSYATDDELLQALFSGGTEEVKVEKGKRKLKKVQDLEQKRADQQDVTSWTAQLEASSAFMALRSRPSYTSFLQCLKPFFPSIYSKLRKTGHHEILISDLLLRYPNIRLFREALELESRLSSSLLANTGRAAIPRRLRPSLLISMYQLIAPSVRTRSLEKLSPQTSLMVARIMLKEKNQSGFLEAWNDFIDTTRVNQHSITTMLELVKQSSSFGVDIQLGMLYTLISNKFLPDGVMLNSISDIRNREVIVLSIIIKSYTRIGVDERCWSVIEDLIRAQCTSEETDEVNQEIVELIMNSCLAEIGKISPKGLNWASRIFKRLVQEDIIYLPGPVLNAWIEASFQLSNTPEGILPTSGSDSSALALLPPITTHQPSSPATVKPKSPLPDPLTFWISVPPNRKGSLSSPNLLRLFQLCRTEQRMNLLMEELKRIPPESTASIAPSLVYAINGFPETYRNKLKRRKWINQLLQYLSGQPLMLSSKLFVRTIKESRSDLNRTEALINAFETQLKSFAKEGEGRGKEEVGLMALFEACLLTGRFERAKTYFQEVDLKSEIVRAQVRALALDHYTAMRRKTKALFRVMGRLDVYEELLREEDPVLSMGRDDIMDSLKLLEGGKLRVKG